MMFIFELKRVVDGDTFLANIHVSLDIPELGISSDLVLKGIYCRLNGIDCPELREPLGPRAKTFVQDWLALPGEKRLTAFGLDKYGRTLVDLISLNTGETLVQALIQNNLAEFKTYSLGEF